MALDALLELDESSTQVLIHHQEMLHIHAQISFLLSSVLTLMFRTISPLLKTRIPLVTSSFPAMCSELFVTSQHMSQVHFVCHFALCFGFSLGRSSCNTLTVNHSSHRLLPNLNSYTSAALVCFIAVDSFVYMFTCVNALFICMYVAIFDYIHGCAEVFSVKNIKLHFSSCLIFLFDSGKTLKCWSFAAYCADRPACVAAMCSQSMSRLCSWGIVV